jgi:hypothetical protein
MPRSRPGAGWDKVANVDGGAYRVPTLSELIEACGPKFHYLTLRQNQLPWMAWARDGKKNGEGPTPEEAVARLWLALSAKAV